MVVRPSLGVLLAMVPGLCLAGVVGSRQQSTDGMPDRPLRLTVEVKSQTYCVNRDQDDRGRVSVVGQVVFGLRLHIANESRRSVILCKGCISDAGPRLFALENNGKPGEKIYDLNLDRFGYDQRVDFPKRPDDAFPILLPGKAFETDGTAMVIGILDPDYSGRAGRMPIGKYFLQADFVTWSKAPDVTSDLKRRWRKYGELYDRGLESDLTLVKIVFPPDPSSCSP